MTRRLTAAMLGFALALFLTPQISLAAEDHIAEAIKHTKEAIEQGQLFHPSVLVTHAEAALTYAEAGQKEKANPHTAEGIMHLQEAIDYGVLGHADVATQHAQTALEHLQRAK